MITITAVGNLVRVSDSNLSTDHDHPKADINFGYQSKSGSNDVIQVRSSDYQDTFNFEDVTSPSVASSALLMDAINALL